MHFSNRSHTLAPKIFNICLKRTYQFKLSIFCINFSWLFRIFTKNCTSYSCLSPKYTIIIHLIYFIWESARQSWIQPKGSDARTQMISFIREQSAVVWSNVFKRYTDMFMFTKIIFIQINSEIRTNDKIIKKFPQNIATSNHISAKNWYGLARACGAEKSIVS